MASKIDMDYFKDILKGKGKDIIINYLGKVIDKENIEFKKKSTSKENKELYNRINKYENNEKILLLIVIIILLNLFLFN